MSKLGLVIVLILMAGRNNAQDYTASANTPQDYFVLIQADNNQAFYVRLDSGLYTSSPAGHLILSRLKAGIYTVTIGFPGQVFPEQRFIVSIHQKDQAFRLKNEDGMAWGLYDGQGQPLKRAAEARIIGQPLFTGVKKDDPFSRLMAALVRDTAVMYNTYVLGQPLADSSVTLTHPFSDSAQLPPSPASSSTTLSPVSPSAILSPAPLSAPLSPVSQPAPLTPKTPDSSAVLLPRDSSLSPSSAIRDTTAGTTASGFVHPDSPAIPPPPPTATHSPLYHPSTVIKLSERKSSRGLRLVYADRPSEKKADTIIVIIPIDTATPPSPGRITSPAVQVPPPAAQSTLSSANSATHSPPTVGSPILTEHPHPLTPLSDTAHSTTPGGHGPNSDSPALSAAAASQPKPALPFVNSDCHAYATDYDVDRLRVRMLEAAKDEDRILAARKIFKTKCFSTHQIGVLSEVFTADAAKFNFLEAAYPFVSDAHFPELVNLLTDPIYSGRFKTLTDRH